MAEQQTTAAENPGKLAMVSEFLADTRTEMVMPGDNVKMAVQLINPVAMDEGLRFAIREGGRTVGAGVVSKIVK